MTEWQRNVTWYPYHLHNLSFLHIHEFSWMDINYRQNHMAFWREYYPSLSSKFPSKSLKIVQLVHHRNLHSPVCTERSMVNPLVGKTIHRHRCSLSEMHWFAHQKGIHHYPCVQYIEITLPADSTNHSVTNYPLLRVLEYNNNNNYRYFLSSMRTPILLLSAHAFCLEIAIRPACVHH